MPTDGFIPVILPFHIVGGVLALLFGYVALSAAKGGRLHRKSGLLFVAAMVALSLTGALIATLAASAVSIVAGLLTFYFVTTALLTVRPRLHDTRWLDVAAMVFALMVAVYGFKTGFDSAQTGRPETAPMFIFGIVGVLAAAGDLRVLRGGGIQGTRRIARHLWRMCFAMWVAAASFFWGPRGRVPEIIDIAPLKAVAVLLPVAAMVYWLWRLRGKQALRGIAVRVSTPESPALERS